MKIVHLSDLHFGTEQLPQLSALQKDLQASDADIIVISGDLTQRATKIQYTFAREFIQTIQKPVLCVPGNHDIPLYNIFVRLLFTYDRYKKFISPTLTPHLVCDHVVILGINSVTPYKPMGGYVTEQQLQFVREFFLKQPKQTTRIVVMHHNLIRSVRHKIMHDAERIISVFAGANINLVLSGHIHFPYIELLERNYLAHNMYVITAGTGISNRTIEPNSYNIIDIRDAEFSLSVRDFANGCFVTTREDKYPL